MSLANVTGVEDCALAKLGNATRALQTIPMIRAIMARHPAIAHLSDLLSVAARNGEPMVSLDAGVERVGDDAAGALDLHENPVIPRLGKPIRKRDRWRQHAAVIAVLGGFDVG